MTNEFQLVERRELREEFIGRMEVLDKGYWGRVYA